MIDKDILDNIKNDEFLAELKKERRASYKKRALIIFLTMTLVSVLFLFGFKAVGDGLLLVFGILALLPSAMGLITYISPEFLYQESRIDLLKEPVRNDGQFVMMFGDIGEYSKYINQTTVEASLDDKGTVELRELINHIEMINSNQKLFAFLGYINGRVSMFPPSEENSNE